MTAAEKAIRDEFRPTWSLIHTDRDRWLALRRPGTRRSRDDVAEVEADTLDDLADRLRKQR